MNVLLVGHGYWGKKIAKTLKQFQDLQLFIYDKAENELNIDDFLVKLPNFDHVFIVTPEKTHYDLAKKFLVLGKNVFVEKPLCLEEEQAKELADLAISNKVVLFVDYIFLYDDFAKKIKEILDSELIGKVNKVSSIRSSSFVNKPNLLVTDDLMIHDLYLLRYFFNNKISNSFSINSSSDSGLKQVDFSLILNNKINIDVFYSWLSQKSERKMIIFGEKGSIYWNKNESFEELILSKNNKKEKIEVKSKQSPLYKSIEDFFGKRAKLDQRYNNYIEDVSLLALTRRKFYEN
jgi:UDP-2-acetamido-3-amino-2,3-dideoxy-glucuronate N-acetyltransferase